ncbi:MAG TPA: tyrosine-type recombinase/integrase [Candidatus Baltobacterales bacterium]|nr:tyrosine-type recombinase/integrase [Candidatus Baltobacterales bacterium]
MIPLRPALKNYLTMRRALGYKLQRTEKLLAQFIAYVEATSAGLVTIDVAVGWATLPIGGDESWWAARLSVVRSFAHYLHTLDDTAEVPPADLMPARTHRAVPYLYSDDEVLALVAAAAILDFPLRVLTYQTLIPLLAVTGIRIGEAIRLDTKDVDFENGLLTVWLGKFGKSRELPLHPSTLYALGQFLRRRNRLYPGPKAPSLFISTAGTRLRYCNVHWTWLRLVQRAGLQPRSTVCRPRIHDLRHSFAVQTVIDAYRSDVDVAPRLPLLSTYLGHVHPRHTYWYLSAAPELLTLAGQRLERSLEQRS